MQPLDQNEFLVPHLKDLFHMSLKPEAQGYGMIFRVCNLDSKQLHLYSAYVLSVPSQWQTTVPSEQILSISLERFLICIDDMV